MLSRQTNQFTTGRKETHYALNDGVDLAICGCGLVGAAGYRGLGPTPKRKVNCSDCIELYEAITADYIGSH